MIEEISVFLAVVDGGSLSKAARLRSMAVSSVSRKLDALEQHLGTRLLQRSSRFLLLTDAGEQFVPRARAILSELDEARNEIASASTEPSGLLTIAAPAAFGRRHVAPAVFSFMQLYPAIDVVLHLSDDLLDLRLQRVDLAIRSAILADSELVATRLAPVRRIAVASPAYLERHGKPDTPQALLEHNCVTLASAPLPPGWWSFSGVHGGAALPVKSSLRSDDTETLLQAALHGVGVAHLASWMVSDAVVAGTLVSLFPTEIGLPPTSRAAVHAVRMPGRSHAAKAHLFIAHLRGAFGEPCYWDVPLLPRTA